MFWIDPAYIPEYNSFVVLSTLVKMCSNAVTIDSHVLVNFFKIHRTIKFERHILTSELTLQKEKLYGINRKLRGLDDFKIYNMTAFCRDTGTYSNFVGRLFFLY